MGFMRPLQPEPPESRYCERRVGQACEGRSAPTSLKNGNNRKQGYVRGCYATLQVFATSEPPGYETNNHQCTDDTWIKTIFGSEHEKSTYADLESLYRSGNLHPAVSKPTTSATLAISTQSPSPLTAPFAPRAARTELLCFGI